MHLFPNPDRAAPHTPPPLVPIFWRPGAPTTAPLFSLFISARLHQLRATASSTTHPLTHLQPLTHAILIPPCTSQDGLCRPDLRCPQLSHDDYTRPQAPLSRRSVRHASRQQQLTPRRTHQAHWGVREERDQALRRHPRYRHRVPRRCHRPR